jgi:hypothetical protein
VSDRPSFHNALFLGQKIVNYHCHLHWKNNYWKIHDTVNVYAFGTTEKIRSTATCEKQF